MEDIGKPDVVEFRYPMSVLTYPCPKYTLPKVMAHKETKKNLSISDHGD